MPVPYISAGCPEAAKEARLAALRKAVEKLQGFPAIPLAASSSVDVRPSQALLAQGVPGLAYGALNELLAAAHGDRPAAFGFLFTLTAAALGAQAGPAVFVAARRALAEFGTPYGHGLAQQGLDVGRLLLIETRTDKDALWAIEETLRSGTRPAMVAGAIEGGLDLTASRRLNLAAATDATPLVLLRGTRGAGTSAAATRWRIAAAAAARDRFGAFAAPRWRLTLERCRNGRPGEWLIEWTRVELPPIELSHVAHRFRLVEGLADRPPAAGLRHVG